MSQYSNYNVGPTKDKRFFRCKMPGCPIVTLCPHHGEIANLIYKLDNKIINTELYDLGHKCVLSSIDVLTQPKKASLDLDASDEEFFTYFFQETARLRDEMMAEAEMFPNNNPIPYRPRIQGRIDIQGNSYFFLRYRRLEEVNSSDDESSISSSSSSESSDYEGDNSNSDLEAKEEGSERSFNFKLVSKLCLDNEENGLEEQEFEDFRNCASSTPLNSSFSSDY